MNFKKSIKKMLSSLVPKSRLKENIKLWYYNLSYLNKYKFSISDRSMYLTTINDIQLNTAEALYYIAPQIDHYQQFYKVKEGDIVIDAGAYYGHLTLFFSKKVGKTGRVYAFEPDSMNQNYILNNMLLNKDCPDNIFIQNFLIWNKDEMVDFCEAGSIGSSALYIESPNNVVKKEAISLDSWIKKNNITKVDFIKMNIEGAEIPAMQGAIELLNRFKPNLAISANHTVEGKLTYLWLEDFFKSINYPFRTMKFQYNNIITFAGPAVINPTK